MAGSPIIQFYIQNYMWNNALVATETLFQTVPMDGEPVINNPKVKNEMGKAGSFEFSMETTSPYYNALLQMKTMMRITYFGHTIFRGRVLTIDKTMSGSRTVHCEGDFAFLLDSHQVASEEDSRPTISVLQYLQQIITQHNNDVEDIKEFALGEVPGQYTNATAANQRVVIPSEKASQQFGDSSWNYSMDRLEDLLNNFGGYFRTRFVEGSGGAADTVYLDWYENYYNASVNTQTIEVAKNLIDISGPTEIENLFTVLIPIGKSDDNEEVFISDYWPIVSGSHAKVNYITVPELKSIPLYSDSELDSDYHRKEDYQNAISRFGYIWKTVTFENANTPEKLFSYAKDWIKNNFMPEITQWSIGALDMKFIDPTNQVLLCGDRVNVVHPEVDQTYNGMSVISAEYDLYNPDKNKYVIGIPNQQINAAYGVKNKKEKEGKSSSGGGHGGGGGGISRKNNTPDDSAEKELERLKMQLQQMYTAKTDWGEDILLDNALAYTMYNTDGTEKPKNQAVAAACETMNRLQQTKWSTTPKQRLEKALELSLHKDDPQILIELNPAEKQKQTLWKAQTGTYMNQTLGLTLQESHVLLNETAGQSMLAAMVDDDGNWTEYALNKGITIRPGNAEIKQMAINTRKILQGEKVNPATSSAKNFLDMLAGSDLNLGGDYFTFDSIMNSLGLGQAGEILKSVDIVDAVSGLATKGLNILDGLLNTNITEKNKTGGGTWFEKAYNLIGGIFTGKNTESGGTQFNLQSSNTQVDGVNAGIGLGANGTLSGWDIALNKTFTYTADGHTYTVPAHALAASDVHFTAKYDSLRANLAVVDNLVADYAQIGTLVALKATVDTINANYITASYINTTNITAALANASLGSITTLSCSNSIGCTGPISGTEIWSGGSKLNLIDATLSSDGKTLTITRQTGGAINFSKAVSSFDVSGANGHISVTAQPQGDTKTVNISVTGIKNVTSNGKYTYTANYQHNNGNYVSTGATIEIDVNVSTSDRYAEGWNACRNAMIESQYYSSYYTGSTTTKYDAPTGGAQARTVLYPFSSVSVLRYVVPDAKQT